MSKHVAILPAEAADRLAIRELVEAYPHCADRRDANGQMALFTEYAHFVVYMDAKDPKPAQELHGRAALAPVFADLNKYAATMHLLGQSTIVGRNDPYALAKDAEILRQRLPRARLDVLEPGHCFWEERAPELESIVIAWVNGGYQQ